MRKIWLSTIALCFIFSFNTSAQNEQMSSELDTLMLYWFSTLNFNGTALVAQHGEVLLNNGYGPRDVNNDTACNANTIYQIGETTELFTATLIYMLQEEGKLKTSDKVKDIFPEYPEGDVTIEHLLTHTSGIHDFLEVDSFYNKGITTPRAREEIVLAFMNRPLLFKPGTAYDYSTSNYMLLGYIIAEVTGKTYYDVVRERIFDPLEMNSSGFDFSLYSSWDKARGYIVLNSLRMVPAFNMDSTVGYAAKGIFSSTGDMYRFAMALINNELISKASFEKMTTVAKAGFAHGGYMESYWGRPAFEIVGETPGYVSSFTIIPEDSTVIILLSNDYEAEINYVRRDISAVLYDKPYELPRPKESVQMYEDQLKHFEGRYEMEDGYDIHFFVLYGVLYGEVKGQDEFTIYAEKGKRDHFFMTSANVQFWFIRDNMNNVTGVVMRKNRREVKGRKWQ